MPEHDAGPAYDPANIFAKIIRGDIPAVKRYENDVALAIDDIAPAAPLHVLVMPKRPYVDFGDFMKRAPSDEAAAFFVAVRHTAEDVLGLRPGGYRLIANTGADALQTVPHFHVHVLGGTMLGGLLPRSED